MSETIVENGDAFENVNINFSEHSSLSDPERIRAAARALEECSEGPFVYCLKLSGGTFYVGETKHLSNRIGTHARDKQIDRIQHVETVPDKETARDREQTLSFEIAIEKNTTDIDGGR